MEAKAAAAGLTKYLSTLVATVLFPIQWMRMMKVARRHEDLDSMASKKVAAAAVLGLLLAGLGTYMVLDFQAGATEGLYDTLDGRLSASLGNEQYKTHVANAEAAQGRVELAERKLAEGEDPALWNANKESAEAERDSEQAKANALAGNHALYTVVQEFVAAQDDAGAKATIANRGAISFPESDNIDASSAAAFDRKDASVSDMQNFLLWLVWPGVIGVFFAPLIFVMGTILKAAYVPSESVGYKQYPGGAMALFLLFGAFGVPALFFAAWTFQDIESRSAIGQIAL